jgi:hypothetical protein
MNFEDVKIAVSCSNVASVAPISSIEDLMLSAKKFANIADADTVVSLCNLSICAGRVAESVLENKESVLDEIADCFISVAVNAVNQGITTKALNLAIQDRLTGQVSSAVSAAFSEMLSDRGMNHVSEA